MISKLERMIVELCPDGVEYVDLADVARISNGKDHKHLANGDIPVYGSGGVMRYANQYIYDQESVLIPRKGSIGNIFYVNVPFWTVDTIFYTKISKQIMPKYLYYYLTMVHVEDLNEAGGVPSLTKTVLDKVTIALPPLPIQREIVRILDNFTELTAELTAELTTRKKQYDYFRNILLSFGDDVPMVELAGIADFKYGFTDTAKDQGSVRFIRITDIGDNGKLQQSDYKYIDLTEESGKYLLKKGDLLMARTGATYGKTMLFEDDIQAVYASFLIRIRFVENTILPAYYWHFAQSGLYWKQANKLVSKAGQPQFNANVLRSVVIPMPLIEEQSRIVSILDRFDALTTNISNGLPAEIAARQKQYEYYRDKLLTFPAKQQSPM